MDEIHSAFQAKQSRKCDLQMKQLSKVDELNEIQTALQEAQGLTEPGTCRGQSGNEVQVLRSHASEEVIGRMCGLNPGPSKRLIVTLVGCRGNGHA